MPGAEPAPVTLNDAVASAGARTPNGSREPIVVNVSDFYGARYPLGVLTPALATASFNVTGTGSAPGI